MVVLQWLNSLIISESPTDKDKTEVLLCERCLMLQRFVLPHSQGQAVKKNEDSFELLDPEHESVMILLDKGTIHPTTQCPTP